MALKLPDTISSKRDIIRLQRLLEVFIDASLQRRIAKKSANYDRGEPVLEKEIVDLLQYNKLALTIENMKQALQDLEVIKHSAHTVRISFASEPNQVVFRKIVSWFRREIDGSILIQIGVQPSIAAGCVVHTGPNRYDFSIRSKLLDSVPKFIGAMNRGK